MNKEEVKQALKPPPLGVEPQYIWRYKRCQKLAKAIHEYFEAKMEPPKGWIDELSCLWTSMRDSDAVDEQEPSRGQY